MLDRRKRERRAMALQLARPDALIFGDVEGRRRKSTDGLTIPAPSNAVCDEGTLNDYGRSGEPQRNDGPSGQIFRL